MEDIVNESAELKDDISHKPTEQLEDDVFSDVDMMKESAELFEDDKTLKFSGKYIEPYEVCLNINYTYTLYSSIELVCRRYSYFL